MPRILKALLIFAVVIGGGIFALFRLQAERPATLSVEFWAKLFAEDADLTAFDYGGIPFGQIHSPREFGAWLRVTREQLGQYQGLADGDSTREELGNNLIRNSVPLRFERGTALAVTYLRKTGSDMRPAAVDLVMDEANHLPVDPEMFDEFIEGALKVLPTRGPDRIWSTLDPYFRLGTTRQAWQAKLQGLIPAGVGLKEIVRVRDAAEEVDTEPLGPVARRVAFDVKYEGGVVVRFRFNAAWTGILWRTTDWSLKRIHGPDAD